MPNTCETCRHWSKIPATRAIHTDCVGECRRRAPATGMANWPRVKSVDFCSEFESDAVSFATFPPDAKPGLPYVRPVDGGTELVPAGSPRASAPVPPPSPAPADELPLSLGTGPAAPTPPDASAKTPTADAPGSTRPRGAKPSSPDGAQATRGTKPAGAE